MHTSISLASYLVAYGVASSFGRSDTWKHARRRDAERVRARAPWLGSTSVPPTRAVCVWVFQLPVVVAHLLRSRELRAEGRAVHRAAAQGAIAIVDALDASS